MTALASLAAWLGWTPSRAGGVAADAADATEAADVPLEPENDGHAFRIGERWFLIPMHLPAEIVHTLKCAPLPFTARWCLGLANFRGELVPVYDLAARLEDGARCAGPYDLILGGRDQRAGLRIDELRVIQIPNRDPDLPLAPLPGLPAALVCRGLAIADTIYTALDLIELLDLLAARACQLVPDVTPSGDAS